MFSGIVLSFKVHLAGCRFYFFLGSVLALLVLASFTWAYVAHPGARVFIRNAVLQHYLPMLGLVGLGGIGLYRLWKALDSR